MMLDEARLLKTKLEIALHIKDEGEIKEFIEIVPKDAPLIARVILLGPGKITGKNIIDKYVPVLKKALPGTKFGGGTDCYFAELNRNNIKAELLDFISFSINPQVHAFDDMTLIENMEAQYDAVISAKHLYPYLPIHVSPVTLKPRFNPDTAEKYIPGQYDSASTSDHRQHSVFAAGWTLGSFRNLAAAGVTSITWYETIGNKGILPASDSTCPTSALVASPVYLLLYFIMKFRQGKLFSEISQESLKYNGILMIKGKTQCWIIVNYLREPLNIKIANLKEEAHLRTIDSNNCSRFLQNPDIFIHSKGTPVSSNTIHLEPYGIGIIMSSVTF